MYDLSANCLIVTCFNNYYFYVDVLSFALAKLKIVFTDFTLSREVNLNLLINLQLTIFRNRTFIQRRMKCLNSNQCWLSIKWTSFSDSFYYFRLWNFLVTRFRNSGLSNDSSGSFFYPSPFYFGRFPK